MKSCKDCPPDSKRPAPYPGPRCATHHRAKTKSAKQRTRHQYVKRTYNLEPEEQDALYEFQNRTCAIDKRSTGATRNLSTDHNHNCCNGPTSCGKCVRGFVSRPVNDLLGYSRDNVEFFQRVIAYLLYPPLARMRNGDERDSRLDDPGRIGRRFRPRSR